MTDEKTERGLRRKEAAGSVGVAFDQQPLALPPPLFLPPHHPLSSAGVGTVPGRRPFLHLLAPLGPVSARPWCWGWQGGGGPRRGYFSQRQPCQETEEAARPIGGVAARAAGRRVERLTSGLPLRQRI